MKTLLFTYYIVFNSLGINNAPIDVNSSNDLTIQNLYLELVKQDVKHPEIVLRQSILETGWFKSYSCKKRHNLFGFWYKGKYKEFDTWKQSVTYYKKWQTKHYKNQDLNYYDFLVKRGYAADPNYISKLKSIKLPK